MPKPKRDPHLAAPDTCGDCLYFGFVTGDTGRMWCCDYTYKTGKFKPDDEPCAKCSVKVVKTKDNTPRRQLFGPYR